MITPRRLLMLFRIAFVLAAGAGAALMLGPFQGLEQRIGLDDKTAHALAFYALAVSLFAVAPGRRRGDLALMVLSAAVLSEIGQGMTGRSMSLGDLAADALGLAAAMLPGWVESYRRAARLHPDRSLADIAATERRRGALAPAAGGDRTRTA